MAITIKLDDLLHDRRMTLTELADRVGMTLANLSILKTGKARAIRFSTLNAICAALSCRGTRAHLQQGEFQMKHPVRIGLTPKVHHAKFPRPMGSAHGVSAKHDAGHDNSAHAHRESED